ncbi:hypothetical protein [Streptomyces sp. NPDC093261]|uniref:hypothetical protein n=1 Tax=Streptomyces sp. NPDC093261 TaxID=3366037 RepID=UPI00380120D4
MDSRHAASPPPGAVPGAPVRPGARDIRAVLDDLDEQIVSIVLHRIELGRRYQSIRRTEGLPASELTWENLVLRRYASRLGSKGAAIARAVLSLSQLTATETAERGQHSTPHNGSRADNSGTAR